jgi:replicative DNA helicase
VTDVESRIPPHDLKAEAAVLSAAIYGEMSRVASVVQAEDFFSESYAWMFRGAAAVHVSGAPKVDPVLIASWLNSQGRLAQVGGMEGITEMLNSAPVAANAVHYARIVKGKSRRRAAIKAAAHISADGRRNPET